MSDTADFRRWLTAFHGMDDHDGLFEGYKFSIVTCLLSFMDSIKTDDLFKLEQDEVCYRAEFRGIKLKLLPNSCEKIILQKNIWNLGKKIRQSTGWTNLNAKEALFPILDLFLKIKKNHLYKIREFTVDESLNYLSQFYAYIFLVDTQFGRPKGYFHPLFSTEKSPKYLDCVFMGYAFSLQYLWYKLLGRKKFLTSCVRDLHRSQEVYSQEKTGTTFGDVESDDEYDDEYDEYELDEKEQEDEKLWSTVHAKWNTIDQFFSKIREEIIRPLEKKTDSMLDVTGRGLINVVNPDKIMLGTLLEKTNLETPSYMKKSDLGSMKKQLDLEFLWYNLDTLNGNKGNSIFLVHTFNSLLTGYVELLLKEGGEGKAKVIKIIHSKKDRNYNYYSLAVLIGSHGLLSDSSGWIVFFDSLMDTPGSGGRYRDRCFECVERFKQESLVDLKEIVVSKDVFRNYLESRKSSFSDILESSNMHKYEEWIMALKSKLFENVFCKYYAETHKYESVRGDCTISGQQVDCLGSSKDKIHVFECKLQFHGDGFKNYLKQMTRIKNAVQSEFPDSTIYPVLVFYHPIRYDAIEKLKEEEIHVIHDLKNKIKNSRTFGEIRKINHMLNFDFRAQFHGNYDKEWFL